jgi:methyl-accepting chemotaxis protein
MFKGASLSFKLYAGFGSVLLIVSLLGLFSYKELKAIQADSNVIVKDCLPGMYLAGELQSAIRRNVTYTTEHIIAPDKAGKEEVEKGMAKIRATIDEMIKKYESTITLKEDRELVDAMAVERAKFLSVRSEKILPLSREGKTQEAMAIFKAELRPIIEAYVGAGQKIVDFNRKNGEHAGSAITASVSTAITGIVVGLLAALALGAAVGIFLSRSISAALNSVISSLSSGSEQVSSASNQVSQSSQQMAEGASQQASSLEETSASLEEMSSMTKQNSDNARQANGMAAETRAAVEKSREAMTRMGDAIGRIKGSSDQTAKIIKTIDEIAFQTNLLALNAAVEAARAGDAGKGFAVVAEEVRNLAQRSAEAAKTTAALIEESQQNANNGVAVSGEVAGILTGIVESVSKLTQLIGEVSAASEEQSKGIEQIGTAVTEMDKLTQSNAANAEESASASEELAAQAKELGDMVQILVGIVKGESSAPRPAASQAPVRTRRAAGPDWSGVAPERASHPRTVAVGKGRFHGNG